MGWEDKIQVCIHFDFTNTIVAFFSIIGNLIVSMSIFRVDETDNETNARLGKWDEFLEKQEEKEKNQAAKIEDGDQTTETPAKKTEEIAEEKTDEEN